MLSLLRSFRLYFAQGAGRLPDCHRRWGVWSCEVSQKDVILLAVVLMMHEICDAFANSSHNCFCRRQVGQTTPGGGLSGAARHKLPRSAGVAARAEESEDSGARWDSFKPFYGLSLVLCIFGISGPAVVLTTLARTSAANVWQLGEAARRANVRAVLASSTAAQYERVWRRYGEFCSATGQPRDSSNTVCVFLSYLAETSEGMGGVEVARAALSHHFAVEQPTAASPTEEKEVTMVLKGLRRRFQMPVTKKKPLSKEEFLKILRVTTEEGQYSKVRLCQLRLAAQISVMFLTFARYEECAALKVEQVTREQGNLLVLFGKGKNYQFGECRLSVVAGQPGAALDPVEVISEYMARLEEVTGNSKGFLFPALRSNAKGDTSLDKPASYSAVLKQFKAVVSSAGLTSSPADFGLHSMRRGGVTAAVNGGADEHFVQKQMRVASGSTVRRYATVDKKHLCSASKAVFS